MNPIRKTAITTLILALSFQIALPARRAQAVVAAITGGAAVPGLVVLGASLGTIVVGVPVGLYAGASMAHADNDDEDAGSMAVGLALIPFLLGALGTLAGVVMLDDSNPASLSFAPLTVESADRLGISPAEAEAFNEELPEINAVAQSVGKDLAVSGRMSAEFAGSRWASYAADGALSPESLSAIAKISGAYSQALRQQAGPH